MLKRKEFSITFLEYFDYLKKILAIFFVNLKIHVKAFWKVIYLKLKSCRKKY